MLTQMVQRLPLSDVHFRRISQLIYQRAGIVLAEHKREMVYNRLVRRLRLLGLHDFGDYRRCWKAIRTARVAGVYQRADHQPDGLFPRGAPLPDPGGTRALAAERLQRLEHRGLDRRRAVFDRHHVERCIGPAGRQLPGLGQRHRYAGAGKAEAGVYRQEDLRTLTPTQMQRYFLRGTGPHQGLVRVRPELAARVNFQPLNLLAPGGRCRGNSTPFLPQRHDLFR